jgi:hypothetical protein
MDRMIAALVFASIFLLAAAVYVAVARRKRKRRPTTRYFSHTFAVRDQVDLKPSENDQIA